MSELYRGDLSLNGCQIIEESIQQNFSEVKSKITEVIEPIVENMPIKPGEPFESLAQNLIAGVDRIKAYRVRPLQVAFRTAHVAQVVVATALEHQPIFDNGSVIDTYIGEIEQGGSFQRLYNAIHSSLEASPGYYSIMKDCHPSIDPLADEPEIFPLFAGFSLLALGGGEARRVSEEMTAAVEALSGFDGDLRELFGENT